MKFYNRFKEFKRNSMKSQGRDGIHIRNASTFMKNENECSISGYVSIFLPEIKSISISKNKYCNYIY
jgi:hypothetical protein